MIFELYFLLGSIHRTLTLFSFVLLEVAVEILSTCDLKFFARSARSWFNSVTKNHNNPLKKLRTSSYSYIQPSFWLFSSHQLLYQGTLKHWEVRKFRFQQMLTKFTQFFRFVIFFVHLLMGLKTFCRWKLTRVKWWMKIWLLTMNSEIFWSTITTRQVVVWTSKADYWAISATTIITFLCTPSQEWFEFLFACFSCFSKHSL